MPDRRVFLLKNRDGTPWGRRASSVAAARDGAVGAQVV
jgi:hypothetical protein